MEICPLVFRNSNVGDFIVYNLIRSHLKTNVLKFLNDETTTTKGVELNSNIGGLYLRQVENIDVDVSIVDEEVFKRIETLEIYGKINSFQVDLFEGRFKEVHNIRLFLKDPSDLFHRIGIDWIKHINSGVNVSLENRVQRHLSNDEEKLLCEIQINLISVDEFFENVFEKFYPDTDFCVFSDFPFQQLVFIYSWNFFFLDANNQMHLTCTYLWLAQFYPIYTEYSINNDLAEHTQEIFNDTFENMEINSKCDFKKVNISLEIST
jgi:hypothetical protein